jgi:hypothetical protein
MEHLSPLPAVVAKVWPTQAPRPLLSSSSFRLSDCEGVAEHDPIKPRADASDQMREVAAEGVLVHADHCGGLLDADFATQGDCLGERDFNFAGASHLFASKRVRSEDDQAFRAKSEAELVRRRAEFFPQLAPRELRTNSARPQPAPHDPQPGSARIPQLELFED